MSSSLRSYDLPTPLISLLDKYDHSCKGAWTYVIVSVVAVLILTIVGSILIWASGSKDAIGNAPDDTNDRPANTAYQAGAIVCFVGAGIAFVFLIWRIILGNSCKEKREIALDTLTDVLQKGHYLDDPTKLRSVDARQWNAVTEQVERTVRQQRKSNVSRRAQALNNITNPGYRRGYY